ncbi:MAG: hypothetical protein JNM00_13225 [Flavobacteriales bacterium]|nr:hypothetical protein [Flavobacteriales bacterium]
MKPAVVSLPALIDALPTQSNQALLEKIAIQVHRDCNMGEVQPYADISALAEAVNRMITPLYMQSRERFMQLVYKVDLSEKMLSPVLANARDVHEAMVQTSVMIIYRCFQKVMTRDYFR